MREPLSAEGLKQQLAESVAILALDGERQRQWCEDDALPVPIDELIQQYTDVWWVSENRLTEEGAIDSRSVEACNALRDAVLGLLDNHSYPDPVITSWDAVATSPEWEAIRAAARTAVGLLAA